MQSHTPVSTNSQLRNVKEGNRVTTHTHKQGWWRNSWGRVAGKNYRSSTSKSRDLSRCESHDCFVHQDATTQGDWEMQEDWMLRRGEVWLIAFGTVVGRTGFICMRLLKGDLCPSPSRCVITTLSLVRHSVMSASRAAVIQVGSSLIGQTHVRTEVCRSIFRDTTEKKKRVSRPMRNLSGRN